MILDPWFYAVAVPAVILVGLAKGGLGGGLALLGVPLMALVVSPLQAAAIMLPILIVMDGVALAAWWGIFDRRSLAILVPSTIAGLAIAWAAAAYVSDAQVRLAVGIVALVFTVDYVAGRRASASPRPHNAAKGWFWGIVGGFTSFVAHAGGPPVQMYLLPIRLDPKMLAGTTVLVFAVANVLKVGPYLLLGQFSPANLATSAVLLPLAPIATFLGVKLVRNLPVATFYRFSYAVLFIVALELIREGMSDLW